MTTKTIVTFALVLLNGIVLSFIISECRQIRQTHDSVIRLEEKTK